MKKLKTLRRKKAYTQRDMARLAGVSLPTYNRIETGIQKNPMPTTRRKIAAALGVNPEDIAW